MKNEYDNESFFEEYAKMSRSKEGLSAAGEWHQLKPLFPPLQGKTVLDLGCGYGWHCKFAAEQGAVRVLGLDLSQKMIDEAKARNTAEQITYGVCGIEEYEYPENQWDLVVSNLALHYIENIEEVFQKVYRTLKPGGVLLFNIEHPVFTAGVGQDWIYTEDGTPKYWPVDDYFIPGERSTHFLGCDVVKQHHTLTQILNGLLKSGFELQVVEEAEPSEEMMDIPGMKDEMRRPMMLLVKATVKKQEPEIKSGRVVIVTGSPGTGKSTISSRIAGESDLDKSVHLHTDDFYHFLSKGAIPPHLPESEEQNQIVIEAFLETARRFVQDGYDVIIDGIIGPWFLEPWLRFAADGYEVHYLILRASREETMKRAVSRDKLDKNTNMELVETMWAQFQDLGCYEANVIDITDDSVEAAVSTVKNKIRSRSCLLLSKFRS